MVKRVRYLGVMGTGSDVGKSMITAALCRLIQARHTVVPFKAQNMSTNAAIALRGASAAHVRDGGGHAAWGEMGVAQVLQAQACRQLPRTAMNPVLLKPLGDGQVELIIDGLSVAHQSWAQYRQRCPDLLASMPARLADLTAQTNAAVVICEGAGSCTEVNLWSHDIVNLPLMQELNADWVLVADIDRGGVFAQVVGTREVVGDAWQRCRAVIVNRLRGDPAWFADGARQLSEMVDRPVHVVPWLSAHGLPEEDTYHLSTAASAKPQLADTRSAAMDRAKRCSIMVVQLPHTAMSSDIAALQARDDCEVQWCQQPPAYGEHDLPDVVIIPGSRQVVRDLIWMQQHWSDWLNYFIDAQATDGSVSSQSAGVPSQSTAVPGLRLFGICGGYQILGESIDDPAGLEGPAGSHIGLGLLPVQTTIHPEKEVLPFSDTLSYHNNDKIGKNDKSGGRSQETPVNGYEIHHGHSSHQASPLFRRQQQAGCFTGIVGGCYIHDMLSDPAVVSQLFAIPETTSALSIDQAIDRWAAHVAAQGIDPLAWLEPS